MNIDKGKKKIAIYSGEIPTSTFTEHLIEGIAKHHHVLLFGRINRSKFKSYNNPNIKIYPAELNVLHNLFLIIYRSITLLLRYPSRFKMLLQEVGAWNSLKLKWSLYQRWLPMVLYKPDIMHLQWARSVSTFGFLKARLNVKLVVSLLGTHVTYTPLVNQRIKNSYIRWFPKVDAFLAVSEAIKLEALKYKADAGQIKVIRSPIPDFFFKAYKPYKKYTEPNRINLLSVGRFHWIKGIDYAIQAVKLLKDVGFEVSYTILGRAQVPVELLYTIHDLGLRENITIVGNISQQELIGHYHNHDILILPSIMEGIANVVLEAMAVGLPVISTDCGGMPEVVKHRETGWLVPSRSPEAIADAVEDVLNTNQAQIKTIVSNAYNLVKRDYRAGHSVAEVLKLYKGIDT